MADTNAITDAIKTMQSIVNGNIEGASIEARIEAAKTIDALYETLNALNAVAKPADTLDQRIATLRRRDETANSLYYRISAMTTENYRAMRDSRELKDEMPLNAGDQVTIRDGMTVWTVTQFSPVLRRYYLEDKIGRQTLERASDLYRVAEVSHD